MPDLKDFKNILTHPTVFAGVFAILALLIGVLVPETVFRFEGKLVLVGMLAVFLLQYVYQSYKDHFYLKRVSPAILFQLFLSALYCLVLHLVNPQLFLDDAGFILRYLDHFAEGCFYCYNIEDGAVFGISSFIHGIFTGFLAWIGFTSETALLLSNYVGLFLTSFFVFQILERLLKKDEWLIVLWTLVMFGSHALLIISVKGMESPLHLALILAPLYFYLIGSLRWMWVFMAIAIISKLTALPVMFAFGLMAMLMKVWVADKKIPIKEFITQAVVFGGIPMILWVIFSFIVFDGPMPQSGYAKLYMHLHSEGFFPFLKYFYDSPYQVGMFVLFNVVWVFHLGWALIKKEWQGLESAPFGLAFWGVMALYFFFNPGERMKWYYVLPEMLMLLQIACSLAWLALKVNKLPFQTIVYTVAGFIFLLTWTKQYKKLNWTNAYIANVEWERKEIGEMIGELAFENDTVAVAHGLTGRHAPGYVIDLAGLNSKMVTDYKLNTDSILTDFRPKWVILHNWPDVAHMLSQHNYELYSSHFEITLNKGLSWRVYKRNEDPFTSANLSIVPGDSIWATERKFTGVHRVQRVVGKDFTIHYQDTFPGVDSLIFGVYRKKDPYTLIVLDQCGDKTKKTTINVPSNRYRGIVKWDAFEVRVPIATPTQFPMAHRFLIKTPAAFKGKIEMVDPAIKELRSK